MKLASISSTPKPATELCQKAATGECRRKRHGISYFYDPCKREEITTCTHCDRAGFVPLGPLPAINLLAHI